MSENRWEQQPGGLYLSVSPFDKANASHHEAAADVLRRTVQTVARTHGAGCYDISFERNMSALLNNDIRVEFMLAKWDACCHQAILLGATISWPTYGIDQQGTIKRGVYTEDTCLLTDKLRLLIKAKPTGKEFPEEGLLECFERLSLQAMQARGEVFKFGEVDPTNTRAIQPQLKNGGFFGSKRDSGVLDLAQLPNDLLDYLPMNVRTIALRKDGVIDPNNFLVTWQEDGSDIRFITTKGQGTASGSPRVDVRIWHNGNLPNQEVVRDVTASALAAIKQETEKRKWGEDNAFAALFPDTHIHIISDPQILTAFTAVGAQPRLFGNKPMMPGMNNLSLA